MATKTYSVPNFDQGLFMAWTMFTQAGYTIGVTLKDSSKTYVSTSRKSTNIEPPLSVGSDYIAGTGLAITVNIPESTSIKSSIDSYNITREDGVVIGHGFNLSVEDSDDNDYNDLYVSLVCWKHKG